MNLHNGSTDKEKYSTEEKVTHILKFKAVAKKYKLDIDYLMKRIGLKKNILQDILKSSSEESFDVSDDEIEIMIQITNECTYSEGFVRLKDEDFYSLLKKLKKEFPEVTNKMLIDSANAELSKEYARCNIDGQMDKETFIFKNYDYEDFELIRKYEKMLKDPELKRLLSEEKELKEILKNGLILPIGDDDGKVYDVHFTLTFKERSEYNKRLVNIRKRISKLSLSDSEIRRAKKIEREFQSIRNISEITEVRKKADYITGIQKLRQERIDKLTADQQRAILSVYLSHCLDKRGYLLPDHFKSGITLINLKVGGTTESKKWATKENIKKLGGNKRLPRIPVNSPVYLLINSHKNVFFNSIIRRPTKSWFPSEYSKRSVKNAMKMLSAVPSDVRKQVFDYLKSDFCFSVPKTAKEREKVKVISEYLDIISTKLLVADASKYSDLHIYRIAYEICAESDGKYIFSTELVNDIVWELKFKPVHWIVMMYIQAYYYKHKELNSLMKFIEKAEQIHEKDLEI